MIQQWIFLISLLLYFSNAPCQTLLTIKNGNLTAIGSAQLTLNNASWENNGDFDPGNSILHIEGADTDSIGGDNPTTFWDIRLNKTNGNLILKNEVILNDSLEFISGQIDLNGNRLALNTAGGVLKGESEWSRIMGPNGGIIELTNPISDTTDLNPGNLGLSFTTTDNLGNTLIRRSHALPGISMGSILSVNRFFELIPGLSGQRATLRFHYFDSEIVSGKSEMDFQLYHSMDGGNTWNPMGKSNQDTLENWVEQVGVAPGGMWTLSDFSPIPICVTNSLTPIQNRLPVMRDACSISLTPPAAISNCGDTIWAETTDPMKYTSQGTYRVTWTWAGSQTFSQQKTQRVIIRDRVSPVFTSCPASRTITLTSGVNRVLVPDLIPEAIATDNCSNVTITQRPAPGTSIRARAGRSKQIRLIAKDERGNRSVCQTQIWFGNSTGTRLSAPDSSVAPKDWVIYPNPASHHATVEFPPFEVDSKVLIYDFSGKLIWTKSVTKGVRKLEVPIMEEGFTEGIYLVQVIGGETILSKRLVVIR